MDYRLLSRMAAQSARMAARTAATPANTDFSPSDNVSTRRQDTFGGGTIAGGNAPSDTPDVTGMLLPPEVPSSPGFAETLLSQLAKISASEDLAQKRMDDANNSLSLLLNAPALSMPQHDVYGGMTRDSSLAVGAAALLAKAFGARDRFINAGVQGYISGQKAESDAAHADAVREYSANVADRQRRAAAINDAMSTSYDQIKNSGRDRTDILKMLADIEIANTKAESSQAVAGAKLPGTEFSSMVDALVNAGVDPKVAVNIATSKQLKDLSSAGYDDMRRERLETLLGPEKARMLSQVILNDSRADLNTASAEVQRVLAQLKPKEFAEVMRMHSFEMADKDRRFGLDSFKAENNGGLTPLMRNDAFIATAPEHIAALDSQIKQWKSSPNGAILHAQDIADAEKSILDIQSQVSRAKELKRIAGGQTQRPSLRDYLQGSGSAANNMNDQQARDMAVKTAAAYEGTKYVWGGRSTNGVDCSGLVCQVYNSLGYDVSGTADSMYRGLGRKVEMSEELEPGDVLFFDAERTGKATHTGIYAGNGMITHASSSSGVVKTVPLKTMVKGWIGTRRVIGASKRVSMQSMKSRNVDAPTQQPNPKKAAGSAQNNAPSFSDLIKGAPNKASSTPQANVPAATRRANKASFDESQARRKKAFLDKTKKARNG